MKTGLEFVILKFYAPRVAAKNICQKDQLVATLKLHIEFQNKNSRQVFNFIFN